MGAIVGPTPGIALKQFADSEKAAEVAILFRRGGALLNITRQFHQPLIYKETDNLFVFYGMGAFAGYSRFSAQNYIINNKLYKQYGSNGNIGANGVVGIEYRFLKAPFVVSLDYKPYLELSFPTYAQSSFWESAISLRYIID